MKQRIENIQKSLQKGEAALFLEGANRFYFTGFSSSAGVVIITSSKAYFLVDFRYIEKAKATVNSAEVVLFNTSYKQIAELLTAQSIKKVYVETESIAVGDYMRLKDTLEGIEVSNEPNIQTLVKRLRMVKSAEEIKCIKSAQAITDRAFSYILERIAVGRTEREIALDIEFFARKEGGESVAFDFIVVSGKNSSLPHGVPTEKSLQKGDFLTMDIGIKVGGYCSDMTRTIVLGGADEEQKAVYDTVIKAQNAAFEKILPGVACKDVDAAARECIEQNYKGCFGHGLGHGVGIDIHEDPYFNTKDQTLLESGMVITVEPGIYIENRYGVRVEDMIHVTESGFENLTKSPKNLIVI